MFRDVYTIRDGKSYKKFTEWYYRRFLREGTESGTGIFKGLFKKKKVEKNSLQLSLDDIIGFNKLLAEKSSSRKYRSSGHIPMPAGHKLKRKMLRRRENSNLKCYG